MGQPRIQVRQALLVLRGEAQGIQGLLGIQVLQVQRELTGQPPTRVRLDLREQVRQDQREQVRLAQLDL